MANLDRIQFVIETLPGARAQVSVNIPTPHPGMHLATPAHSLAIDALGWLGKQPAVAGFVYSPSTVASTPEAYRAEKHHAECFDEACPGCIKQAAHIVLDLETLSTQPSAAIASIGAVALTAHGGFVSEFHVAVDTGAPQHLRHVCPNTCAWWDEQSEAAKLGSILAHDTLSPSDALHAFTAWVQQHADPKKVKVWGNGSSFDNVILSSLYADYPELVRPWAYWNDRDMRTVLDLYPQAKDVGEFEGVKHNALHDASHEAKQLAAALRLAAGAATPPAHAQAAANTQEKTMPFNSPIYEGVRAAVQRDMHAGAAWHSDTVAVYRFADEMAEKMEQARAKGRGGWETCPPDVLSRMLREHVEKGDPRDVANFCMMLWGLGQPIAPATQARDVQRDAEFEAVRKKFCKLQRYSFLLDDKGNVRWVPDYSGNWVEFEAAHTLFDPASVDAAIAAQATQGAAA